MRHEDLSAKFLEWSRGNELAAQFLDGFFQTVHLWDDMVDGDPCEEGRVNRTLFWLLCELPRNTFFNEYRLFLTAQIQICVDQWLMANELERTGDLDKQARAFGLRDSTLSVISQVAYVVGGYDHMTKVSDEVRNLFTGETLNEYRELLNG